MEQPIQQDQGQQTAPPPTTRAGSALLGEPVVQKNYGSGNALSDPNRMNQPLEEPLQPFSNVTDEPDIFRQKIKEAKAGRPAAAAGGAQPQPQAATPPKRGIDSYISNPSLNQLPEEERMRGAENLAKLLLFGYGSGKKFLDKRLQITERKVLSLVTSGKIDLDAPIPIPGAMARHVSFNEFVVMWNQQVAGTIRMDPAWRAEVEPILIRVLAKHGAGLTDEQQLLTLVASDIVMTGQQFWAQRQTMNAFFAYGAEMTKQSRGQAAPPPPPPPESPLKPVYPQNYERPQEPYREPYTEEGGGPERIYSEAPPAPADLGIVEKHNAQVYGRRESLRNLNRVAKKNKAKNINSADPGKQRPRFKSAGK